MAHHKSAKHSEDKKNFFLKARQIYLKNFKLHFILLWALFAAAALGLLFNYFSSSPHEFIKKDVSLKGGISVTISTDFSDIKGLEEYLESSLPTASLILRTVESNGKISGIIIEATDVAEDVLLKTISQKIPLTKNNYSTESMGSSLGESFFQQMFIAITLAFICMGFVFQIYFKNLYATAAALFSAFMDLFITLGVMTIFGMRLTAGGIAAYLMLIGYSIDTSILLSTKMLKQTKSNWEEDLFGAMRTGLTMSAAGLAATIVSFLFTNNSTLKQIMLILIVGLTIDLLTTWIGNVAFLRFYMEKKNVKAK
ncbi:MAG: hypothetical protein ABIJ34_03670 [archaeon]